jgi:DNA polymerase-3 subunit delta
MIVKNADADRFASRPPQHVVAVLFYGPDEGLVRERAATIAKTVVPDLSDPFRVAELAEETLTSDPARLFDEAAAISMLGGRRVVRVRGAGNAQAALFERLFAEKLGDALIVVEAGELQKSSALRKAFEGADNAAAIACYADSERDLAGVVRAALKQHGLEITPDGLSEAVGRLGGDRGITRQELEKLALYAQHEKSVTAAHVEAVMGDESELKMEQACDYAGEGDYAGLDSALARLWAAGASPVAVLRLGLGHFQKLALVRADVDEGGNARSAMMKLRPPLHFSRQDSFEKQISRWTQLKLQDALSRLYEAEALVKTTAVPAEAATSQVLFSVCRLAANARR